MARQKITTIFNKNHITIEVIENPESNYIRDLTCEYAEVSTYSPNKYIFGDEDIIDEPIDTSYVDEYEEIENSFIKAEDAEKLKKLIDKW